MCKICADSVKEFFPDVPKNRMGDFLMSVTCFPFGDGKTERRQLRALRKRTANWKECFAFANDDLDKAIKTIKLGEKIS